MRSERRHELQHNTLKDWLEESVEKLKPYQNAIVGTSLLVLVAIIAVTVWQNYSGAYAGEAWSSMRWPYPLSAFQTQPELKKIAQDYSGTSAAPWALILSADTSLAQGNAALFENKVLAQESLKAAEKDYQSVVQSGGPELLRQRALFGLARTLETEGKLDDAAKNYEQLSKTWPEGMFKQAADERLKDLQRQDTKWFYDQFASFTPQPPAKDSGSKDAFAPLPENPPEDPLKAKSPLGSGLTEKALKDAEKAAPSPEKPAEGTKK